MFEGKLPQSPAMPGATCAAGEGAPLRELSWSDLSARLAAARELRAALAVAVSPSSSFDAPFAARVAMLESGKEAVNPSDLAYGKGTGSIAGLSSPDLAQTPDQPMTDEVGTRP